ncbi:MAG TPA: orotidine-5'-phosphate decarboxylase [Candidatus Hydrogenedens sp.]|nr:orotidine-5'-phosphate decarboxylase [Candidatus Hydrogenedens sp.]HOK08288.1 orotidine-5'-phosphate decarboxylase [Candidatus Hydrogenedens sp.]HOL18918.1 orotidine-5'-phosphate decarboxylase [Candidatus Hydrogenedens sp.]HPP57582.1 orotidine-5'-phosphate decarboxylase [Candidatus Hydrogenedens sp.]
MSERLILGLDVDTISEVKQIVSMCPQCLWYKVGSQLFTRCGHGVITFLKEQGKKIFLDLKYHDIPNTVRNAVKSACSLGVDMLTIHALGGRQMVKYAREGVEGTNVKIIAVTILTSHTEEQIQKELGISWKLEDAVYNLANMALSAGGHGIVCSPVEIAILRARLGNDFLLITPGVRPTWASETHDQARVMTPKEAIQRGANMLVLSRPILKADNPGHAFDNIVKEIEHDQ